MSNISKDKFKIVGINNIKCSKLNENNITYSKGVWIRLKRNKVAIFSFFILLFICITVVIGPYLTPHNYWEANSKIANQPPNLDHWFGTDSIGRDLFSRVCKGGQVSIIIGIVGTFIESTIGVIYGGISGYFGGIVDDIMMRVVEVLLSIPYLIVVIITSLILGKGVIALIIAMTITGWCSTSRLIRGEVLKIKGQDYVLESKLLGAGFFRIIKKHLIPNAIGVLIVNITFDIPTFIFAEAFLSYIGLGVQSPKTSLGALAASGQPYLIFYPYQLFFPALFISLIMLCFNLLGDGLRDALDPKLRR